MSAPLIQRPGNNPQVPIDPVPVGVSAISFILPLGLATVCGALFLSGTSTMVMNARKLEDAESNSFKKLLECEEEAKNQVYESENKVAEMEKNNLLNILLECEKEKNNLKNDLEKAKNELEKAQKPEQRTIIICEGDDGEIRCENPKTLKIESAIFGRSESQADVCPFSGTSIDNTNCRLDVLYRLSDLCDDKTRCPIPSTKSEFGDVDPCPGTYKYVEVTYTCA